MEYKKKTDPVHKFYGSAQWQRAREAYKKSKGGLCENCLKKGIFTAAAHVHHIRPLKPEDLDNAELTTGFGNLRALCERCHEEEHQKHTHGGRYTIDEQGNVEIL